MCHLRWTIGVLSLALAAGSGCALRGAPVEEGQRIARLLRVEEGMHVADVGAGDGEFTFELAKAVGPGGLVYATEVKEEELDGIREQAEEDGFEQVETILGGQDDTGLPAGCCDAILLRLVYHHFTEPAKMRRSLRRALREDGLLLVIDLPPQSSWRELEGVPDRGGHGITADELVGDMRGDGWTVIERIDDWDLEEDHYGVLLRAAPVVVEP